MPSCPTCQQSVTVEVDRGVPRGPITRPMLVMMALSGNPGVQGVIDRWPPYSELVAMGETAEGRFLRRHYQNCAKVLVRAALQRAELARPEACESCDTQGDIQAHHWDYSRPLKVEWLCAGCHRRADEVRRFLEQPEPQKAEQLVG